jgi:tetratricopeptide (TPR) repeat protein
VPLQKIAEISKSTGNLLNTAKAYMDVADVYARNKEVEKAIHSWCQVVALDPEHMAAHTRLALVYERLGRSSDAMVELIAIASLLQYQGNLPKAIQTIKRLAGCSKQQGSQPALNILQSGKISPQTRPTSLLGTGPFLSTEKKFDTPSSQVEDRPSLINPGCQQKR